MEKTPRGKSMKGKEKPDIFVYEDIYLYSMPKSRKKAEEKKKEDTKVKVKWSARLPNHPYPPGFAMQFDPQDESSNTLLKQDKINEGGNSKPVARAKNYPFGPKMAMYQKENEKQSHHKEHGSAMNPHFIKYKAVARGNNYPHGPRMALVVEPGEEDNGYGDYSNNGYGTYTKHIAMARAPNFPYAPRVAMYTDVQAPVKYKH